MLPQSCLVFLMRILLSVMLFISGLFSGLRAERYEVASPSGQVTVRIEVESKLHWSVLWEGKQVFDSSEIRLEVDSCWVPDTSSGTQSVWSAQVDDWVEPDIPVKRNRIRDNHRSLLLRFPGGVSVEFRAYDNGGAYRFLLDRAGEVRIDRERFELRLPKGSSIWFPEEESMVSHNERFFDRMSWDGIVPGRYCSLPVLVETPDGVKLWYSESDLFDYPAMYLEKGEDGGLNGKHSRYVIQAVPKEGDSGDRNEVIVEEAPYIALTSGRRAFPWRVCVVGALDTVLPESDLVYLLAAPSNARDVSWVKPGRAVWDWYHANNLFGVDFEAGINTETYMHGIDFAAEHGLEYVILDEGWSVSPTELFQPSPAVDLSAIVSYAKTKGVGVILWCLWKPVAADMERLFDLYRRWGIAGVKIDFMQRSDQAMVNFYNQVAECAFRNRLLVDFHGSFKPTGLIRTYPNVLSYEGVKGNENNKWSSDITPRHNVTLPFTRMVAGPMDYTPGAMSNAQPEHHRISFEHPMGIGTRCHELAKYVVYESPLQMLCDSPSKYRQERDSLDMIARIPSVWDDTLVLDGRIGEFIVTARRKGESWYVGAMSNENARILELELGFLSDGVSYSVHGMEDGVNAHRHAEDYRMVSDTVTCADQLRLKLAPGGGWVGVLSPIAQKNPD